MKKHVLEFSALEYLIIFCPLLLYPAVYLPYRLWGVVPFANLVRLLLYGAQGNPMWIVFHAQETVIFFWLAMSAIVMLAGIVIAILKVRPWYFIPVYLIVIASLCGILSLAFYHAMPV